EESLGDLFEDQVRRGPDRVAVAMGDAQVSYGELNRRANQLAHYLRRYGVKEEGLVGVCVERSVEMVVGSLAILKAGGAYGPIDPSYPRERVAFMMEDAGVGALLTQRRLASELPPHTARLIYVDEEIDQSWNGDGNPEILVSGRNVAYVIYTSGSTGKPK